MKLHPTGVLLWPDNKRVVVRPFISMDPTRVQHIIARALALSEPETEKQLSSIRADFSERHIDLDKSWLRHFERVRAQIPDGETISEPRRLFIGALFSGEYALESAALFNPSIVPHPDQTGLGQGDLRFILSLRSTGEGHISSIQFRTGVIHRDHSVEIKKATPFVTLPELNPNPTYHKRTFLDKLGEMGFETADFLNFRVLTLNGQAVQNKGMALFPRRIDGRYVMLTRQDDENLYLAFSDNPHFWSDPLLLEEPQQPWEFVKLGNCGSPIETEAGWLVLTHGVGPMRKYCIGATLLDLHDPARVIGRLKEPLLRPEGNEREGYVPNVVYSCGSLVHNGQLILPYGISDTASSIVRIELTELLAALT